MRPLYKSTNPTPMLERYNGVAGFFYRKSLDIPVSHPLSRPHLEVLNSGLPAWKHTVLNTLNLYHFY